MTALLGLLLAVDPTLDPPPTSVAEPDADGFLDCRGVLHRWDEEDD